MHSNVFSPFQMFLLLLSVMMVGAGSGAGGGGAGGGDAPDSWDAFFMQVSIFNLILLTGFNLKSLDKYLNICFSLQLDAPDIIPDEERPRFQRRALRRLLQQHTDFTCVTIAFAVVVVYIAMWMFKVLQQ